MFRKADQHTRLEPEQLHLTLSLIEIQISLEGENEINLVAFEGMLWNFDTLKDEES